MSRKVKTIRENPWLFIRIVIFVLILAAAVVGAIWHVKVENFLSTEIKIDLAYWWLAGGVILLAFAALFTVDIMKMWRE